MRAGPLAPVAIAVAAAAAVACASGGHPHSGMAKLWRDYQTLPGARAIAIAGDPSRVWVGAAAGGASTQTLADEAALVACERKRFVGRFQAPCLLYARGDEIVWRDRALSRR